VSILYYIGILYFPGTLLHELSHFLAAVILRVPVASFSIMPKVTPTGILFGRVSALPVEL
jgi:membrane-associated protease RseP (regulator of RpoE activity)